MRISTPSGVLALFGPARLVCGHEPVKLRTKGLALLYVLALEGPMLRERVIDLLWNDAGAQGNLRVELHRLRAGLRSCGIDAFPSGQDPLQLPEDIVLDRTIWHGDLDVLEGLDDLSPMFQTWLEAQRGAVLAEQETVHAPLRQEQVEQVARQIRPPFVIVVRGPPGSGRHTFVRAVADHLGMPLVQDPMAPGGVVHALDAPVSEPKRIADHIVGQQTGVWAVTQSSFGRDGELLLRLRKRFPPERLRFLDFDALPWPEARSLLLGRLPFEEAARIYVDTGGNLDYVREMVRLRPTEGFGPELPLPQRVRAAFLLEAKELPDAAHAVLDQISLHPGTLSAAVLDRLGATEHLDTLEQSGWLRFDTEWAFTCEAARRVIARTVLAGRRALDHRRLADAFAAVERDAVIAVAYHEAAAGGEALQDPPPGALSAWAQALVSPKPRPVPGDRIGPAPTPVGHERAVLLDAHHGLQSSDAPGWSYWVRRPQASRPSLADYALPDERCVVRIHVRSFTESAFGIGFSGDAFPLRLWFRGGPSPQRHVILAPDVGDAVLRDGTLLLSHGTSREVAFIAHHRSLRVECRAEAGVVEFQLRAQALASASSEAVPAFDLVEPATKGRLPF